MPKIKTHKATVKRFKLTGGKKKIKIVRRKAGQDHFNAKESAKKTLKKRKDLNVSKQDIKNIKNLMPYV